MRTSPLFAYRVSGGVIVSSPPVRAKVTVLRKAARRISTGASIGAIRSQHRDAAAGAEMLAGDERGLRRAEERDRGGDLCRMREPAHPDHPSGCHPGHLLEKFGVGPAGLAKTRRRRIIRAVGLGLDAAWRH